MILVCHRPLFLRGSSLTSRSRALKHSRPSLVPHRACPYRYRACGPRHAGSGEHSRSSVQFTRWSPTAANAHYSVSSTMRTARSGRNLFDFDMFMAPFFQALEPSQNQGRFRHSLIIFEYTCFYYIKDTIIIDENRQRQNLYLKSPE